jgi:hypothetical protein
MRDERPLLDLRPEMTNRPFGIHPLTPRPRSAIMFAGYDSDNLGNRAGAGRLRCAARCGLRPFVSPLQAGVSGLLRSLLEGVQAHDDRHLRAAWFAVGHMPGLRHALLEVRGA